MPPGWNLGNSFDATPNETSWGNPTPNQTLIKAVHAAGFNTLRIPVTWTNHIGAAPAYTIDSAWMAKVTRTAQWAVDEGMFVFVNTHHDADGQWITFPATAAAAAAVAAEVKAVWTQIATAFKSFDSHLMLECFNEPHNVERQRRRDANGPQHVPRGVRERDPRHRRRQRDTPHHDPAGRRQPAPGRDPVDAERVHHRRSQSPDIDPHLLPDEFRPERNALRVGKRRRLHEHAELIAQEIRAWLPTQPIVIGEWGSMGAQATTNRVAHALAYSQDVTTAGMVPVWWDNGGSGSGSYGLFNRTTGAQTFPTIVSAIMTGVKNGQSGAQQLGDARQSLTTSPCLTRGLACAAGSDTMVLGARGEHERFPSLGSGRGAHHDRGRLRLERQQRWRGRRAVRAERARGPPAAARDAAAPPPE